MDFSSVFTYCGKCGSRELIFLEEKKNECLNCGWVYYQNPVSAVVSIISFENQFLFLRRAKDPGAGKLDMPGGFVDFGETAEEALRRELKEELMIESVELTYFTSAPNHYLYLNVPYQTLDFYFAATIFTKPDSFDTSEIMEICWRSAGEIVEEEFAFSPMFQVLRQFLKYQSSDSRSFSR